MQTSLPFISQITQKLFLWGQNHKAIFNGLPYGKCWVSRPLLSHLQVAPDSGSFSGAILIVAGKVLFRRNLSGTVLFQEKFWWWQEKFFFRRKHFLRAQTILQNTYWAENWRNNFSSSSFLLVNSVFLSFRLHVMVVVTKGKRSFLQVTPKCEMMWPQYFFRECCRLWKRVIGRVCQ